MRGEISMDQKQEKEIVHCTDCKSFDCYNCHCVKGHNPNPPYKEWYCADGEKGTFDGYKDGDHIPCNT